MVCRENAKQKIKSFPIHTIIVQRIKMDMCLCLYKLSTAYCNQGDFNLAYIKYTFYIYYGFKCSFFDTGRKYTSLSILILICISCDLI